MMVGRAVELTVHKDPPQRNDRALVVENLSVIDPIGQIVVNDVSFDVRGGEILAVAGVQGNGQTELTEALLGLQPQVRGSALLDGEELVGRSVRHILERGRRLRARRIATRTGSSGRSRSPRTSCSTARAASPS